MNRAQTTTVGVALLVGITMVALGALTAGVGSVVDSHADRADATLVAGAVSDLRPGETTGVRTVPISFTEGLLSTADRDVRVLDASGTVARYEADALVYDSRDRSIVFLAGAVVRRVGDSGRFLRVPPVTATGTGSNATLVVGVPVLNGTFARGGNVDTRLRVDVTHRRRSPGVDDYRLAVETTTPGPWKEYFEEEGATVTRRDFDGDGTASVVAAFPSHDAHLLVHATEVRLDG